MSRYATLLLIILSGCVFSCQKELGFNEIVIGTSPATYTLDSVANSCSSVRISGIYTTGIALGPGNSISFSVNVSAPGTYSISTQPANGITFSGSGNFSTAGIKEVILSGSGTPLAAGTTLVSIGAGNCTFSIPVQAGTANSDYLEANIGFQHPFFNANLSAVRAALPGLSGQTLSLRGVISSRPGSDNLSIVFKNNGGDVAAGVYNNPDAGNILKNVTVNYTDSSGKQWITSSVNVGSFTAVLNSLTPTRAQGTINGRLTEVTSSGSGTATVIISNGSFSIPIN